MFCTSTIIDVYSMNFRSQYQIRVNIRLQFSSLLPLFLLRTLPFILALVSDELPPREHGQVDEAGDPHHQAGHHEHRAGKVLQGRVI